MLNVAFPLLIFHLAVYFVFGSGLDIALFEVVIEEIIKVFLISLGLLSSLQERVVRLVKIYLLDLLLLIFFFWWLLIAFGILLVLNVKLFLAIGVPGYVVQELALILPDVLFLFLVHDVVVLLTHVAE